MKWNMVPLFANLYPANHYFYLLQKHPRQLKSLREKNYITVDTLSAFLGMLSSLIPFADDIRSDSKCLIDFFQASPSVTTSSDLPSSMTRVLALRPSDGLGMRLGWAGAMNRYHHAEFLELRISPSTVQSYDPRRPKIEE